MPLDSTSPPAVIDRSAPAPTPAPAPIIVPRDGVSFGGGTHADGDGISQVAWLHEMREMRREAAVERRDQTKAFVDALDTLGTKMDANFDAIRTDLRRHLTGLIITFVLALAILASLAGVGVGARGLGIAVTTTPAAGPTAPASAPAPAPTTTP